MATRGSAGSGQLRIIGGRWRGRKLRFKAANGLRPTPDRVRETLFNWLAKDLPGARCLDLFAGSGALGLEALSRGAGFCSFIDANKTSIRTIREHLTLMDCARAECRAGDALKILAAGNPGEPYEVVFLDPPFNKDLLGPACEALENHGWLADAATVYLEAGIHEGDPDLPSGWQPHREKTAGDVRFRLFVRQGDID